MKIGKTWLTVLGLALCNTAALFAGGKQEESTAR